MEDPKVMGEGQGVKSKFGKYKSSNIEQALDPLLQSKMEDSMDLGSNNLVVDIPKPRKSAFKNFKRSVTNEEGFKLDCQPIIRM